METHSFCQPVLGFIGFERLETKNLVSTTASEVSHPPNQHMLSLKKHMVGCVGSLVRLEWGHNRPLKNQLKLKSNSPAALPLCERDTAAPNSGTTAPA
jgi:hypothetical protein